MEIQRTQFAVPAVVDRGNASVSMLQPLTLSSAPTGGYDERWLQDLLYTHPELLPIEEIEPVFSGPVPVSRELPTRVGPLDLVYINKQGLLTLVECKLWRNPEARRQVVGQILDYAQEISRWTFDELNHAITKSEQQAEQACGTLPNKHSPEWTKLRLSTGCVAIFARANFYF